MSFCSDIGYWSRLCNPSNYFLNIFLYNFCFIVTLCHFFKKAFFPAFCNRLMEGGCISNSYKERGMHPSFPPIGNVRRTIKLKIAISSSGKRRFKTLKVVTCSLHSSLWKFTVYHVLQEKSVERLSKIFILFTSIPQKTGRILMLK